MEDERRVGDHFGPYKLLRLIGRGGTACVWEAYHGKVKRVYALKIFHEHVLRRADEALIKRVFDEYAAAWKVANERAWIRT